MNDGDAFALMVKLLLGVDHNCLMDEKKWVMVSHPMGEILAVEYLCKESERSVAARRAIVRAAAEIGKEAQ